MIPDGERGVSEIVGFALVFSLVVSVVAVVSVAGMDSLQSARDAEQINNAERALEVLANNMADVHDRGAPSRATEISLDDAQLYMGDPVTFEVSTSGTGFSERYEVRPIVYRGADDTRLVYVMGSVFRVQPRGAVVLEEWGAVADDDQTVLPIVNTTSRSGGTQSIQSSTVLVRANARDRQLAYDDSTGSTGDVTVRIESPRRDLWVRMLDDREHVDCATPAPEVAECTFTNDPQDAYVVHTKIAVALKE